MTNKATINIRNLCTYDECAAVRQVQRACWGFESDEGLYPPLMLTAAQNGGQILGAFNAQGDVIGYLFGYLGRAPGGPLKLCSQTMGILPGYRGAGIATALKLAQREHALAQNLALITWTYDPLEAPNARLNLYKLGGIARTYKRNAYGESFGQLNQGLPSDRFLLEWWLESEHVTRRLQGQHETLAEPVTLVRERDGQQYLDSCKLDCDDSLLWIEIPRDIQALKKTDVTLARDWRAQTRQLFEHYFEHGYAAVDFIAREKGGASGYVLRRD